MTLLQHHLLALGITSAMTLGFSLFALWKNPKRNLNRSVALYCLSLAWWSGWECAAFQMPTKELTYQFFRIEYLGVVFIPTLLCTLVTYLLDFSPQKRRRFLAPLYLLSIAALFPSVIFPGPYFLSMANSSPVAYLHSYPWTGSYYWLFLVFFIGSAQTVQHLALGVNACLQWHEPRPGHRFGQQHLALTAQQSFQELKAPCSERLSIAELVPYRAFSLFVQVLAYDNVHSEFTVSPQLV